jgi:hypothetical protein
MRLMCWDVDVIHCPDLHLVNADYWLRLGADIDFDPLFWDYLQYTMELQKLHAAPTDLPMHRENMPYYQGPRIQPQPLPDNNMESLHIQSILTDIVTSSSNESTYLTNVPVRFGHMHSTNNMPKTMAQEFLTSEFASYAFQAAYFNWAVYLFSNGHYSSTI